MGTLTSEGVTFRFDSEEGVLILEGGGPTRKVCTMGAPISELVPEAVKRTGVTNEEAFQIATFALQNPGTIYDIVKRTMGKVLILEHHSAWSRFVAETLFTQGYEVIELEQYRVALSLVEEAVRQGEEYDFMIVDPLCGRTEDFGIKPLDVARKIAGRFPKVPLIVASSGPTPDEAVQAYEIGALAYIPKTFDESQLLDLVKGTFDKTKSHGS